MTDIVTDVSNRSMALAVERNLIDFWTLISASSLVRFERTPGMLRYFTGVRFPLMNGILDARLDSDDADAQIDNAIRPFQEECLPMMWWTGPSTTPSDLGRRLAQRGFVFEQPVGMAVDLLALNQQPAPEGLEVEVAGPAEMEPYAKVLTASFEMPGFVGTALMDIVSSLNPVSPPWRLYIGRLAGQAVATSMIVFAAGVAGIYNVATLPEARGRGIGREMTLVGLRNAREAGYRIGILQSSPMGYPVYKSIGFRDYCQIGQHVWTPPERP